MISTEGSAESSTNTAIRRRRGVWFITKEIAEGGAEKDAWCLMLACGAAFRPMPAF
jgi:hypothetical protein